MNWLIMLAFCVAYSALGWYVRGPLASSWWRGLAVIAQGRVETLEGELAAAHLVVAAGREVYLRRVEACGDCPTCRPEPKGFGLPDYEFGDRP